MYISLSLCELIAYNNWKVFCFCDKIFGMIFATLSDISMEKEINK